MSDEVKQEDRAVKASVQGEGAHLKASFANELLPQEREIVINRTFTTKDPLIIKWYYDLAIVGKFGERLAYLIELDAYNKIKETTGLSQMTTDEKIDQIAQTVMLLSKNLGRTQHLAESNMTAQIKAINYLQSVNVRVKGHQAILEALEICLSSEDKYTPSQIKSILEGVKASLAKADRQANSNAKQLTQPK